MKELTKKFLKEYDPQGNFSFPVNYRKGAKITCGFGLAEGYRIINKEMIFDSVRIHTGVDRKSYGSNNINIVIAPFNFNRSEFIDYGKNHVYGSILRLFCDEYNFEMRIIHMSSQDINPTIKHLLLNKQPIPKNTVLGKCGNYGSASLGRHTHTEFLNINGEKCEVLEEILQKLYNGDMYKSYSNDEVIDFYLKQSYWKNRTVEEILEDWKKQKKKRRVQYGMINQYKYVYKDWYYKYEIKTRYSSELLFNGL